MTIYCGVDFHTRQQTVCYCDTRDGEVHLRELDHERDDVRGLYAAFTSEVIVGIEASGYSTWFVEFVPSAHQHAPEYRRRARPAALALGAARRLKSAVQRK